MDIFNQIGTQKLKKIREGRQYSYELYINDLLNLINDKPDLFVDEIFEEDPEQSGKAFRNGSELLKPVNYDDRLVIVSPEPLSYIELFKEKSNDQEACRKLFMELTKSEKFTHLKLDQQPSHDIWFNETSSHINLRPGIAEEEEFKMGAIQLGNINVHGLIGGRTGSGKSVFLNNIIQNLLTEYAPWELDVYLADFKKVELSRYVTKYKTPHINAVAATSEIRYVISMFEYLVSCMKARESLFTYLGVQNLKEFRNKFQVVLPRVILIVDEFQQMFQESTFRESEHIKNLLTSIAKLGRATGFHLLFASQDMSGALSSRVMANFKLRFSLPADSSVSSEILGNSAAASLNVGYVISNDKSGAIEDNVKYRVPYINDDEEVNADGSSYDSYFYERLKLFQIECEKFNFNKQQKFYQEDYQESVDSLYDILNRINDTRYKLIKGKSNQYLDIFTLGYGVVYSNQQYDLETAFIEKGLNKNILVVSPIISDIAYIQDLLAINFATSSNDYKHYYFNFNGLVSSYNNLNSIIETSDTFEDIESIEFIKNKYNIRKATSDAYHATTLDEFIDIFINSMINLLGNNRSLSESLSKYRAVILEQFEGIDNHNIETHINLLETIYTEIDYSPVKYFVQSYKDGFSQPPRFSQEVYWISTLDYLERIPRWYSEVMRSATSLNMLFINFFSTEELQSEIVNKSEYIFISGNVERLYNRTGVDFTNKGLNSIVIDFKIRSLSTQRSFKKFEIESKDVRVPSLNFDNIMNEVV
ncbi:hypothetical protein GIY11_02040 [Aerococcaceae bacterium DSM 109653]|uniref:FtsK domain-containing protein n=1 Tax=Fundicoccus ignavus TaxID=2664442 RepID=A0A844BTF4_9LACT|nr:FtsK/SpoIIIE domain-containing protein [Fundicoccus ignavus]MRI80809.1 hypothetical protein [Fundicoccus ignavus]